MNFLVYFPSPFRGRREGGIRRNRWVALMACAFSFVLLASPQGEAVADELPPGFYETTVIEPPAPWSPTALAFAPDGDVFVADKDGRLYPL